MLTNILSYFSSRYHFSDFRYICQSLSLWSLLWRVSYLSLAWSVAILSITADQIYLTGWRQLNIFKIEKASILFPLNRSIALGPSYYFILREIPSDLALAYIDRGLKYDPNATDILQAKIRYSLLLGKKEEAVGAYNRLSLIAPNSDILNKLK